MIVRYATRGALLLAVTATAALAQTPPTTPPATTTPAPPSDLSTAKIPVRDLGPVISKSTHQFSSITSIRGLPDGGLFVNDNQRRQVVRLDATLQKVTIVSDTGAGAKFPYTQRQAGVLSYLGDSTIVVDPTTLSLVVLNPEGDVVRVMAPPRLNDMGQLTSANIGGNAFDMQGRLIYKGSAFSGTNNAGFNTGGGFGGGGGGGGGRGGPGGFGGFGGGQPGGAGGPGGPGGGNRNNPLNQPDSLPILRADFDRRAADTVAFIKVPRTEMSMSTQPDGSMRSVAMINPLPQGDDWALLSDGTVAVVRVLDYRVDFFAPDGSKSTSGKLPFDWKRITDEEKEKLVEDLRVTAKEASDRAAQQQGGGANNRFRMSFEPVPASKLPDYVPPIRPGTTLADHDGNLWLLPMTSNVAAQIAQQLSAAQGGQGGRGGGLPGMLGMGGGGFPGGGGDRGGDRGADRGGDRGGGGGGGAVAGGRGAGRGGAAAAGDTAATRRAAADSAGRANPAPQRAPAPFQLVYDVMNRKGELIERVKLPANRTLLGFAPGGVVFLGYREGRTMTIEVAKRPTN